MTSTKTDKQLTGSIGEEKAVELLLSKGYQIVTQNYRYKRNEIDIICRKGNFIIFVEVKTRKNSAFGFPEEHVSDKQIHCIQEAAIYFLENYTQPYSMVRYDIVSIMLDKEVLIDTLHLEDAF